MKSYLIFIFLLISLTSCFEVVEQVVVKADGSGKYVLLINMENSKGELSNVFRKDSVYGMKVPTKDSIQEIFARIKDNLKATSGVQNVVLKEDWSVFKFSVSFDFDNQKALSSGINTTIKKLSNKPQMDGLVIIEGSGEKFVREFHAEKLAKKKSGDAWWKRAVFSNAHYNGIFKFDKKITNVDNEAVKVSSSRTSALLRLSFSDILAEPEKMSCTFSH